MARFLALCVAPLVLAASAQAQFPFLDLGDCSGFGGDPTCTPTATCTVHGNDPAIYDPANVSTVPNCLGGQLLGPVPDADGTPRHACLYEPSSASTANPLPLVVFLHPSLFTADSVQPTGLLASLETADLSGDPARPGFILLAPEGRNTCHYYPSVDQRGEGWDNWYRNLDPNDAAENVDVWTIDHFIAERVASGKVDAARIYVTGWSNGAAMGILYGLHRPGIAAVGVFSAPDPFRTFNDPCPQVPVAGAPVGMAEIQVPNPAIPIFHLHNDCDIAGICPNGERMEAAVRGLPGTADHLLINTALQPVSACEALCGTDPDGDFNPCASPAGYTVGVANHVRWPLIYNSALLDFFRNHPLATAPDAPEPLTVAAARVRQQRSASGNGQVIVKGEFAATAAAPFDASAPVTLRVDDGLALDRSQTFASGDCVARGGGRVVVCKSADRSARVRFRAASAPPAGFRFTGRFRRLAIDGPFAPPVTVTLTAETVPGTTWMGALATCTPTASGLRCRRR
jgi:predicted esterase